jgi:hypothetical protein
VPLVLLAVAAPASAKIVVGEGIAGAELGMTQQQVLDELGDPDESKVLTSPIGGFDYLQLKYGKTRINFNGVLASSTVLYVTTKDRDERTAEGIGIGSKKGEVKDAVDGVQCANEFGIRHCHVGEFLPGEIVTDFLLKKKQHKPARVKRVSVGYVID